MNDIVVLLAADNVSIMQREKSLTTTGNGVLLFSDVMNTFIAHDDLRS